MFVGMFRPKGLKAQKRAGREAYPCRNVLVSLVRGAGTATVDVDRRGHGPFIECHAARCCELDVRLTSIETPAYAGLIHREYERI